MWCSKVFRWIAIGCSLFVCAVNAAENLDYSWATLTNVTGSDSATGRSRCVSPGTYYPGTCVPVTECPALVSALRKPQLSPKARHYLQASLCYYYKNEPPVVCCLKPAAAFQQGKGDSQPTPPAPNPTSGTQVSGNDQNRNSAVGHPNARLLPAPDACGEDSQEKIVGGRETPFGTYPWMVLLKYRKGSDTQFLCGGSLISNRYVLTAAHCINKPNGYQLVAALVGEHNINTDPDCIFYQVTNTSRCAPKVQEIAVEEELGHPEYTGDRHQHNDIALIRLQKPVDIHDHAKPICLPFGEIGTRSLVSKNLTSAGWGWTENRIASNVRLSVIVPVTRFEDCARKFQEGHIVLDKDKQLCAGGEEGKDSCRGDSGGALMGFNEDGKWYCDGVVSFGSHFCGSGRIPTVYTRTSHYLNWILNTIRE